MPVVIPLKRKLMLTTDIKQTQLTHLIGLCARLPAPTIGRVKGTFCRGVIGILTLDFAIRLHFFHQTTVIVVCKGQRFSFRSRHRQQTPQHIVSVSSGTFRRVHGGHLPGGIVVIAGNVIQCIPFFCAVAIAVIGIMPLRAGVIGLGDDPPVRIQLIAVAFPLRVNHFKQLQAVRVITVLPAVALTIYPADRQVKRPVFNLPVHPPGISPPGQVTVPVMAEALQTVVGAVA
ncbi:hypothetical protein Xinn_03882 [Xenorhabdus innexi]|uniref:Uncharacterized protein n=1 Tax=Xenorhabdus innexi TaxID=290109 RepID=A0A2G0N0A8_9GAMM|nr:hypothetical protein Xinn_03882 [Xenorhabdus innexi]